MSLFRRKKAPRYSPLSRHCPTCGSPSVMFTPVQGEPVDMVRHMGGRPGDQPVPGEPTEGPALLFRTPKREHTLRAFADYDRYRQESPTIGGSTGDTPVPGEPVGDV